jgi:hypothetical protein
MIGVGCIQFTYSNLELMTISYMDDSWGAGTIHYDLHGRP